MRFFKKLLGLAPSARDYYEQSLAWEQQGDHAGALAALDEAIRLAPEYADAYYVRGLIFDIQQDDDRALAELETVSRLRPATIDSLAIESGHIPNSERVARVGPRVEYLFEYMLGEEGSEGARRITKEASANDIARIRLRRGIAYNARGEFAKAIGDFSEVIRLRPGEIKARYLRGSAYGACARFKEAIADLTEAITFDPPAVQLMLGNCYKQVGDYDRATAALSAAVRLDRTNPDAFLARAMTHQLQGQQDKAIADYTEVLRLDPESVRAYEGRAEAHRKTGDERRATGDEHSARELLREDTDSSESVAPPSAQRVAARVLVLAAVIYRAHLENDPFAEPLRAKLLRWIDALELGYELERSERALLHTPIGVAEEQLVVNARWRAAGLGVLAWALHRVELPPYDELIDLPKAAARVGFTEDLLSSVNTAPARELVQAAGLRPALEIRRFASQITIVSWRLRQFQVDPDRPVRSMEFDMRGEQPLPIAQSSGLRKICGPGIGEGMDFAAYLRAHPRFKEQWLDGLRFIDGDLAIGDRPVARAACEDRQNCTSNAIESQIAAYWLQGDDRIYSEVNPSTLLSAC
jgi:tetratricopeptide (TPR) repeat protein